MFQFFETARAEAGATGTPRVPDVLCPFERQKGYKNLHRNKKIAVSDTENFKESFYKTHCRRSFMADTPSIITLPLDATRGGV